MPQTQRALIACQLCREPVAYLDLPVMDDNAGYVISKLLSPLGDVGQAIALMGKPDELAAVAGVRCPGCEASRV